MTKKQLRQQIEAVLSRKDKLGMHAVGRALVHLKNRQTEDEQRCEETRVHNKMGFQPIHAKIGTSMANFYEKNGYLSPKQVAFWQSEQNKLKKPVICRYWKQLVEEAEKKMAAKEEARLEEESPSMTDEQLQRLGVDSQ